MQTVCAEIAITERVETKKQRTALIMKGSFMLRDNARIATWASIIKRRELRKEEENIRNLLNIVHLKQLHLQRLNNEVDITALDNK